MTAEEQLAEVVGGKGILIRWKTIAAVVGIALTGLASMAGWVFSAHNELVRDVQDLKKDVAVMSRDVAEIRDRLYGRNQVAR